MSSDEHRRLLGALAPLPERGWTFIPISVATPGASGIADGLLGMRTSGDTTDTIRVWEQWAVATRFTGSTSDTVRWSKAGRIGDVVAAVRRDLDREAAP